MSHPCETALETGVHRVNDDRSLLRKCLTLADDSLHTYRMIHSGSFQCTLCNIQPRARGTNLDYLLWADVTDSRLSIIDWLRTSSYLLSSLRILLTKGTQPRERWKEIEASHWNQLLTAVLLSYLLNSILGVISRRSPAGDRALLGRSRTPPTLEVAHGT
jgi:hypothetical protein